MVKKLTFLAKRKNKREMVWEKEEREHLLAWLKR
jgi:hypothetical protein